MRSVDMELIHHEKIGDNG